MNAKLVESLAQIIKSLTPQEKALLEQEIKIAIESSEKKQEYPSDRLATPQERSNLHSADI